MNDPIAVEPTPKKVYRVAAEGLPGFMVEAPTREEARAKMEAELADRDSVAEYSLRQYITDQTRPIWPGDDLHREDLECLEEVRREADAREFSGDECESIWAERQRDFNTGERHMAFRDFTFPQVQDALGLRVEDAHLFPDAPPLSVREEFAAFVRDGAALAQANSTEKAKSEFIIAPVLLELRRMLGPKFVLFSGVEWTVDAERGLSGYCDFLLGRGPSQHILQAPFVAVVEAKNDLIRSGLGQCIAAMVAARVSNERAGVAGPVYGVVTTGSAWKFLRLTGDVLTMDVSERFIDDLAGLMGVLRAVVESP